MSTQHPLKPSQRPLQPAQLSWQGDTPEAELFGDIYFSRDNGAAESTHVFLQGNQLAERFAALSPQSHFVIGETGFGTGLNFLLTWQLWQHTAPPSAQLFFISTELHPLTLTDLQRALGCWPALHEHTLQLLAHYPPLTPGFHWLRVAPNVTLLLLFGDARDTLPQLHDSSHSAFLQDNPWQVDAWFLDGFAPAKNPQLWQLDLLGTLASLSKPGTTLATFTAAGDVRRGLQANGFVVEKVAGYGRKREMVTATFTFFTVHENPAGTTPWLLNTSSNNSGKTVAVIGGGLAGCHIARALAERGCIVTLLEQHDTLAAEASGNPQGALYTKLSANTQSLTRLGLSSLQYAVRHYQQDHLQHTFSRCGLLQLSEETNEALLALFQHDPDWLQWLDHSEACTTAGVPVTQGGWWLPQTGWVAPREACTALIQHENISVLQGHCGETLEKKGAQWTITTTHTALTVDHVVLACANRTPQFAHTAWVPLRPVRGQISLLPATPLSEALQCVICDEGYLAPAHNGHHSLGASFVPDDSDTALRDSEHNHNRELLAAISPALHAEWASVDKGRAALRATTPDHLPLVGPLPEREAFLRDYAALRHNARGCIPTTGSYVDKLWLFSGFGGRGLCYIPLAAELLCSQILQQPRPVSRELQMALAPARFVIRELVREIGQRGR